MNKSIKSSNRTKFSKTRSGSSAKKSKAGIKSSAKKSSGKKGQSDVVIQYVLPIGRTGWVVKNSKLKGCTLLTDSKREAVHYARSIAQRRGERLMIYGRNRKLEETRKYRKPALKTETA